MTRKILFLAIILLLPYLSLYGENKAKFMQYREPTKELFLLACQYYGVHHSDIVLAQARLESGNFRSNRAVRDKNLLGIKKNGRYCVYQHWSDCIRDYRDSVQYKYKHGEDYYSFLTRIGYAENKEYITLLKQFR